MASAIDTLFEAFGADRPAVLFLGQDFARAGESDVVLDALLTRLEVSSRSTPARWREVFAGRAITNLDYQWLTERFDRRVPTEGLEHVFELPWSGVFTTSLDHRVAGLLETRGRLPETILAADHFSRAPRSKARPAVHYLFGRAADEPANAPKSTLELKRKLATNTIPLLNRIKESATPLGLVVVDGFVQASDWLELDDLLAAISEQPAPRILWFGAEPSDSEFVKQMIEDGSLICEPQRLAGALAISARQAPSEIPVFSTGERTISLPDDKFFQLHPSLRLRVEAAAAVVDDSWTDEDETDSTQLHELFQRFHGDFGGPRATVQGVLRGFAIQRDFEARLYQATDSLLKRSRDLDSFVILHGQSGTGKTISLARLAVRLRTQLKIPVLFSWGRVPLAAELDDFCEAAEEAGAPGTVVICDGSHPPARYIDLTTGLKSKGRRVVVVGSCYRIEEETRAADNRYVYAPEKLSAQEIAALNELLIRFGHQQIAKDGLASTGDYFLALLYRYLTASRARLASGVSTEARAAEGTIRIRAKNVPPRKVQNTLLAEKLIAAGIQLLAGPMFEDEGAGEESDAAARLIDYVMAAGRLDCAVPVNLLLRSLRKGDDNFDISQVAFLFQELDLFRWRPGDPEGNTYLVQPRLQLEAELICRKRLADRDRELQCLLALLSCVRASSVDEESEIQFALDLVHKLHRDGPRKNAYRTGYLSIARTLTQLRVEHHVLDARLMLQESAFRREALFAADKPDEEETLSDAERDVILNEAREVVEFALVQLTSRKLRGGRRLRQNFAVERASIYGFLAVGLARRKAKEQEIWSHYQAARTAVQQAISGSDAYHPIDVGLWTPADILKEESLSPVRAAELRADILSTLDQASTGYLSAESLISFHTRKMKVASLFDDASLRSAAFSELEAVNPPVAYFLHARNVAADVFSDPDKDPSELDRRKSAEAADFLEQRFGAIENDVRCLQLLLHLKWICLTGRRLFSRDRSRIPPNRADQRQVHNIVSTLNSVAGEGARNSYRLLEAALEWLVGDVAKSREQFRSLGHDSDFEDPARVLRRLLLESDDGQGFVGKVRRQRSEGHWEVQVTGFQGDIDLLSRDFRAEDPRAGRDLRGFNIAFNYLGPIADPLTRKGGRQ